MSKILPKDFTSWVLVTQLCPALCKTPWTVASRAPLSMEFSRHEYGVGSHSLPQGIFPIQGLNLGFLHCGQILYRILYQILYQILRALYSEP